MTKQIKKNVFFVNEKSSVRRKKNYSYKKIAQMKDENNEMEQNSIVYVYEKLQKTYILHHIQKI